MADGQLTEATFNENLNTKFSITLDEKVMELELVEIKPYREEPDSSMERFSIYFEGPVGVIAVGCSSRTKLHVFIGSQIFNY